MTLSTPITDPEQAPSAYPHRPDGLDSLLSWFAPVTLEEARHVALQDRVDTKFVLRAPQLAAALPCLTEHYSVLDIEGVRRSRYETFYFDTADFDLYHSHHSGKLNRFKVRSRRYLSSGLSYLEVKFKTNKYRTVKDRLRTPGLVTELDEESGRFVAGLVPVEARALALKLCNEFSRVTLVSRSAAERVTIDLDVSFRNHACSVSLPGVVIAEVKQAGAARASAFRESVRALGVRPTGFSKYCVGVAMLFAGVKRNRFKPKLRLIEGARVGVRYVY